MLLIHPQVYYQPLKTLNSFKATIGLVKSEWFPSTPATKLERTPISV